MISQKVIRPEDDARLAKSRPNRAEKRAIWKAARALKASERMEIGVLVPTRYIIFITDAHDPMDDVQ